MTRLMPSMLRCGDCSSHPAQGVLRVSWNDGGERRCAYTPDSGDAQAGGVSPPFTVCAHSWFEVWGAWGAAGGGGVGRGE